MSEALWQSLGVASPLVAVLLYLLKTATEERRDVTQKFVTALQTTVAQSTSALVELSSALRDTRAQSMLEHERIIATIAKLMEHQS